MVFYKPRKLRFMPTKFVRTSEALFENIDGETVLLNLQDGCYYGLNATAKVLWEALEAPCTREDLCQIVNDHFDTDTSPAGDVEEFLESLAGPGLIIPHVAEAR